MNAQDLKNSILQLAIQGKLVEQRKDEGTAKELIEEIKAEKERLIREKKIKKEKPLAEITEDEVPFEIPESWEWVRVIDVADIYTGNSISESVKQAKYTNINQGYDYIATKDIGFDNKIIYNNGVKIPFEEEKFRCSYKNSILMCIEGGSAGRKIGILDRMVCFGNKLCSFNTIVIESLYMYYYLQSPIFTQVFKSGITGIIGGVSINKLKTIILPLPTLAEQKRIVTKIEELMPYIEKYGDAYSKLEIFNKKFPEDMQKSILQYAIQGKLVDQREEEGTAEELYKQIKEEKEQLIKENKIKKEKPLAEITEDEVPFEIPESWKWARLGEIVSIKGGKRLPAGKQLTQSKTDHIYIRVTDMKNQTIDDTDLHYIDADIFEKISNYIIEKSDIYIVIVGSTIGKVGLVPERFHGMNLTENAARLIPICMDKDYLMRYLSATAAQIQFIDQTKQVGQPKLALIRLKNTLVPIPPLSEQKRIVAKIEEMLPYCKQLVK